MTAGQSLPCAEGAVGQAVLVPLPLVSGSACRGPSQPPPLLGWALQPASAHVSGSGGHFWPEHCTFEALFTPFSFPLLRTLATLGTLPGPRVSCPSALLSSFA